MALRKITDLAAASTLIGSEFLEVSQASTTVKITAITLSAAAVDNSYNDSGAGFLTAGFALTDRVRVVGFTGNVVNNILVGVITAITAGKMTIGGTDGDVIVDDAAGESVTISKWTSRRALLSDIGLGGGTNDILVGFKTVPTTAQVLETLMVGRTLNFPANFAGSLGKIGVNPTASFVISVQDDGVEIGTVTISAAGVFTFATTSGTAKVVAIGSELTFVAPATVDATANNATMTFLGTT